MQVSKVLYVSDKEVYDVFIESLKNEIKFCTERDITPYEGFKYKKEFTTKMGRVCKGEVLIEKLEPNKLYKLVVTYEADVNTVEYQFETVEGGTKITYIEDYDTVDKRRKVNHQMIEFIMTIFTKRKAKRKLKNIEQYILVNR